MYSFMSRSPSFFTLGTAARQDKVVQVVSTAQMRAKRLAAVSGGLCVNLELPALQYDPPHAALGPQVRSFAPLELCRQGRLFSFHCRPRVVWSSLGALLYAAAASLEAGAC